MDHPPTVSTSRLANEVARAIHDGFARFHDTSRGITRRAPERFVECDWRGLQEDARQRLEVRDDALRQLVAEVRHRLGDRLHDRITWVGIKAVFSALIGGRDDWELAETFFNSVTRRVFTTVGIDPEIEFVHTDFVTPPTPSRETVHRRYEAETTADLIRRALEDHPELLLSPETIERDAERVASKAAAAFDLAPGDQITRAEFTKSLFYRGEHAYLMGRTLRDGETRPLVVCLTNDHRGPHAEALLTEESDVSLLFSFTRSYFQVEVHRPHDMVLFISSLIPRKRVAEIYISLGYNKHGKTELYRNALHHLAHSTDNYQLAEGSRGMVMVVFTMRSYPVVFKIIRDRFDFPKDCSRTSVIDRYHLIFTHDRAGRLVDAQEYEYLVLSRSRFDDDLLAYLHEKAEGSIAIEGDSVVIKHCYAERRVTPLNVYWQQVEEHDAVSAVLDYGQAIKDLAMTNLFPGDLLPKNFGVTHRGRVVFYDYDEVCLVTECNFRKIPKARCYEDEMAGEPWYGVGPYDIFPEEFINFLGLPPRLREAFVQRHGDLLEADYWNDLKQRLVAGELFHVPPYVDQRRLSSPERRASEPVDFPVTAASIPFTAEP